MIKNKIYTDKIFYFGDTIDDIICGKNADVKAIGVLPPQDKGEELKNMMYNKSADYVIENINELTKIAESQNA